MKSKILIINFLKDYLFQEVFHIYVKFHKFALYVKFILKYNQFKINLL